MAKLGFEPRSVELQRLALFLLKVPQKGTFSGRGGRQREVPSPENRLEGNEVWGRGTGEQTHPSGAQL